MTTIRTYQELIKLKTFKERFNYLKLGGKVGEETFGFDRYLNQKFYRSAEWKRIRDQVILRDNACDLGMVDREINSRIIIHHMNPLTKYDVINQTEFLLNPDYMICVTKRTHDAIHYGDEDILFGEFIERSKNDTCPWRMTKMTTIRTYQELVKLKTFKERFNYLKLGGKVGEETFGFDRYLNQKFYKSAEWKRIRDQVILRDNACDLGMVDREINSRIIIHHMNPLTKYDVINQTEFLLNPDYMICVTKRTHDAIHYGDENILFGEFIERSKNDTCPWRR